MEEKASKQSKKVSKSTARFVVVNESHIGQRIDNFLMRELKDVPRSYVYRILRKGEVRVNKKRIKPVYKLQDGDSVRIPPVFLPDKQPTNIAPASLLEEIKASIILEDEDIIFINKPSGLAVHGGSGVRYGLIESFRQLRTDLPFIELVHRLDKETSGIVMLAKNRQTLLQLHEMMKQGAFNKYYQTLIKGEWSGGTRIIKNQLQRQQGRRQKVQVVAFDDQAENNLASNHNGKARKTKNSKNKTGKESISIFSPIQVYKGFTLMKVELLTGRMHQIRAQLADLNHPVIGDSQYGDFGLNREAKKQFSLKRLFLHAYHLEFTLAKSGKVYNCKIPLAEDLTQVIKSLNLGY